MVTEVKAAPAWLLDASEKADLIADAKRIRSVIGCQGMPLGRIATSLGLSHEFHHKGKLSPHTVRIN
jgi:hypothetical protein